MEPTNLTHFNEFSIVSPALTIKAMRDSGYKNTDYAIAELIDNSIDAKASLVELVVIETPRDPNVKFARDKVTEIAVIDNGSGMEKEVLRRALRFGDGSNLAQTKSNIGRFGMGLPQSSVSQCKRVDVWTWQNGCANAWHSYLDLEEIENGESSVPEPKNDPVPHRWKNISDCVMEPSGTLVVWTDLDRVRWTRVDTTIRKTEELCGRIYRKFLNDGDAPVQIDLLSAKAINGELSREDKRTCKINDPLYLMQSSSTPEPFSNQPMFEEYNKRSWKISRNNNQAEICVICAMARPDAINEKMSSIQWPKSHIRAGKLPWGKHADRNKGVSIVRGKRELDLSQAWVNSYEPEERWWSVEVQFDPLLDDVFGVVNNKQHAHAFEQGAAFDWRDEALPGETYGEYLERLKNMSDHKQYLVEVWVWIKEQIVRMRKERKKIMQNTGPKSGTRHPHTGKPVEDVATDVIKEQVKQGERGQSDRVEPSGPEEKISLIEKSLANLHVDEDTAHEWAVETVYEGRRVLFKSVSLPSTDSFFISWSVNDIIEVWLNSDHKFHEHFIEVLEETMENVPDDELVERLNKANFVIRLLFIAWARYKDKAPIGLKQTIEDIEKDWGREARDFLNSIES